MFDQNFPPEERLPLRMDVALWETQPGTARMTVNAILTGDPLTDNSYVEDGYRFHDVMHLTHAACLGWSPTLRSMLGRQRRSNPDTARREDSKRAIVTEEGIVAMVFSYAERRNFLQGHTGLEPLLLDRITEMTARFEVSTKTRADWERTTLIAYNLWRQIRDWKGGRLRADLQLRVIEIFPPPTPNSPAGPEYQTFNSPQE